MSKSNLNKFNESVMSLINLNSLLLIKAHLFSHGLMNAFIA